MMIIITSTPTSVSNDVSSWLSVCCRLWATLSMSLVTRLSRSPTLLAVDVGERQAVDLALDVGAHRYIVRCTTPARIRRLQVLQHGRADVQQHRPLEHVVQLGEVDAVLAVDDPAHDDVGGVAEQLGPEHRERHARHGQRDDGDQPWSFGRHRRRAAGARPRPCPSTSRPACRSSARDRAGASGPPAAGTRPSTVALDASVAGVVAVPARRSRRLLGRHLRLDDLDVGRARLQQLIVGAEPDRAAVLEHEDLVGGR